MAKFYARRLRLPQLDHKLPFGSGRLPTTARTYTVLVDDNFDRHPGQGFPFHVGYDEMQARYPACNE